MCGRRRGGRRRGEGRGRSYRTLPNLISSFLFAEIQLSMTSQRNASKTAVVRRLVHTDAIRDFQRQVYCASGGLPMAVQIPWFNPGNAVPCHWGMYPLYVS